MKTLAAERDRSGQDRKEIPHKTSRGIPDFAAPNTAVAFYL
jgi:hypothetical protein